MRSTHYRTITLWFLHIYLMIIATRLINSNLTNEVNLIFYMQILLYKIFWLFFFFFFSSFSKIVTMSVATRQWIDHSFAIEKYNRKLEFEKSLTRSIVTSFLRKLIELICWDLKRQKNLFSLNFSYEFKCNKKFNFRDYHVKITLFNDFEYNYI